jgi:hypothetical protein
MQSFVFSYSLKTDWLVHLHKGRLLNCTVLSASQCRCCIEVLAFHVKLDWLFNLVLFVRVYYVVGNIVVNLVS